MNFGIIGAGNLGRKRAASLGNNTLKAVADISIENAYSLATEFNGVKVFSDYRELIKLEDIDVVIVSTVNNQLAQITRDAVKNGKHVLVEKPCGINYKELGPIIALAKENKVKVKAGYNLRCHPAFIKAKKIIDNDILGNLIFVRGRYGHGGRKGYETEWRSDPEISGGGELIDQGSHLIDLSRWFLGDFEHVNGFVHNYYWNMSSEDNAFIRLATEEGKSAWLHASCTEWKNMFSFEIYGTRGKLHIEGLGGSYGTERLTYYNMHTLGQPPKTIIYEYPQADKSLETEINSFVECIENNVEVHPDIEDAYETLKIVDRIYNRQL